MSRDEITQNNILQLFKVVSKNSVDYSKPGAISRYIDDPNVVTNVSKLISLSGQRSEMAYAKKR
jgi:transposase